MANWELSPAFQSVNKKLGNMVFYNIDGTTFARRRPVKRSASSAAQESVTGSFKKLSASWRYLDGIVQASWNTQANKKKRISAYSAFIGANINRHRNGEPLGISIPAGENGLVSLTARPGSSAGEIICEFTKNVGDADKFVTFFRQKKTNGSADPAITRIETGAGILSPFTITGCESGSEYFIYAVLTDKAYIEAGTVSAASAALSAAS